MKNKMKYWKVRAMFGHVGDCKYYPIDVPCVANSKERAIYLVANTLGGVKHNRPEAIIRVQELTHKEYKALRKEYSNNPYVISKFNTAKRIGLLELIKDSIKQLPRESHQFDDCKESKIKFRNCKYQAAVERAERDIRAYLY